jgi:hypothetical protein
MLMFGALALLAGACGDDDDPVTTSSGDATSTTTAEDTTTSTTSTTTTSTTTTSEGDDPDGVPLEQSYQSPDGFTISYPSDWEAVTDCGQFGPAPLDEPTPNTDERTGVVSAYIDPVPFEQVAEPTEADTAREETTIDGLPAVRVEGEQSGPGHSESGDGESRSWRCWLKPTPGSTGDDGLDVNTDPLVAAMNAAAEQLDSNESSPTPERLHHRAPRTDA